MKKILSVILAVATLISVCMVAGCTKAPLKFGMGVFSAYGDTKNAEGENNGSAEISHTLAAVLLDKDGKVVKCEIDSVDYAIGFTSEGKVVLPAEIKTKYELGENYGMTAQENVEKEWFEQIDIFENACIGKTIDEIKALVVEGYKPNEEVANAGCTIAIADYVKAVEKAVANAKESAATEEAKLNLGIVATAGESTNATAEENGVADVETAFAAAVIGKDGKVIANISDAAAGTARYDEKGAFVDEAKVDIVTKLEAGENYGMATDGSDKKEWFEQAAAFDAACAGKTADEISALAVNGKGNSDLQAAGCTIHIADMVKAAVKAATVK